METDPKRCGAKKQKKPKDITKKNCMNRLKIIGTKCHHHKDRTEINNR